MKKVRLALVCLAAVCFAAPLAGAKDDTARVSVNFKSTVWKEVRFGKEDFLLVKLSAKDAGIDSTMLYSDMVRTMVGLKVDVDGNHYRVKCCPENFVDDFYLNMGKYHERPGTKPLILRFAISPGEFYDIRCKGKCRSLDLYDQSGKERTFSPEKMSITSDKEFIFVLVKI